MFLKPVRTRFLRSSQPARAPRKHTNRGHLGKKTRQRCEWRVLIHTSSLYLPIPPAPTTRSFAAEMRAKVAAPNAVLASAYRPSAASLDIIAELRLIITERGRRLLRREAADVHEKPHVTTSPTWPRHPRGHVTPLPQGLIRERQGAILGLCGR